MVDKLPTLQNVTGGYQSSTVVNNNLDKIEEAFNNTISRNGATPNFMEAQLDMNSNRVINVGQPSSLYDAVHKKYVDDLFTEATSTSSFNVGSGISFDELDDVEAADISGTVSTIVVRGGNSVNDGGSGLYAIVGGEPNHPGKVQSNDGKWWELISPSATPEAFRCVGDGVTDDKDNFQKAINWAEETGGYITGIPSSIYSISSSLVINSSNVKLVGNNATLTFSGNNNDLITIIGTAASKVYNTEITGWQFEFDDDGLSFAVYAEGFDTLKLTNNYFPNGGKLLWTWLPSDSDGLTGASWDNTKPDVSQIVENDLNRNLLITENIMVGNATSKQSTGRAGTGGAIRFSFIDTVGVHNNLFTDHSTAILWWGGDSNPGRDGGIGSVRWARNISITGNACRDMSSGGIWGSQGQDLAISGNTALRCGDIGIHGEGSLGITVSGNLMVDCANGGMCPFFNEEIASYVGNTVYITDVDNYGDVLVKFNMGFLSEGIECQFASNTMKMVDTNYSGRVIFQRSGDIRFTNNMLVDTYIDADDGNAGDRDISHNQLLFTRDPGTHAILVGRALHPGSERDPVTRITNNVIKMFGWVSSGIQAAIYIKYSGAGGNDRLYTEVRNNNIYGWRNESSGNTLEGFNADIITESLNTVGQHSTIIMHNGLWKGVVVDISDKDGVNQSSLNQRVKHIDNYSTVTGFAYPYQSAPTNGVYMVGSRGYYDVPTAGDPEGFIALGTVFIQAPTEGAYDSGNDYVEFQQVTYDSKPFICISAHGPTTSDVTTPGTDNTVWRQVGASVTTFKDRGVTGT